MKNCSKCGPQEESQFTARTGARDGLQRMCRPCKVGYDRERYLSGAIDKKALRKKNHQRWLALRKFMIEYLSTHPCVDCGEADVVVLEFDHVRGQKVREVSIMIRRGVSKKTLLQEIAKCDVRCANCHRRATARRSGQWNRSKI
jgi:hypothetical protein